MNNREVMQRALAALKESNVLLITNNVPEQYVIDENRQIICDLRTALEAEPTDHNDPLNVDFSTATVIYTEPVGIVTAVTFSTATIEFERVENLPKIGDPLYAAPKLEAELHAVDPEIMWDLPITTTKLPLELGDTIGAAMKEVK